MIAKNPKYEYTAVHVANSFVKMGKEREDLVDLLRLMKYTYFAKGWHFAFYDKPLFAEKVEAWRYGPVVPSVYHTFKNNLGDYISEPEPDFDFEEGKQWVNFVRDDDQIVGNTLNMVWNIYEGLSPITLSRLTHAKGTPWKEVYDGGFYQEISDEAIRLHFRKKRSDYLKAAEEAER